MFLWPRSLFYVMLEFVILIHDFIQKYLWGELPSGLAVKDPVLSLQIQSLARELLQALGVAKKNFFFFVREKQLGFLIFHYFQMSEKSLFLNLTSCSHVSNTGDVLPKFLLLPAPAGAFSPLKADSRSRACWSHLGLASCQSPPPPSQYPPPTQRRVPFSSSHSPPPSSHYPPPSSYSLPLGRLSAGGGGAPEGRWEGRSQVFGFLLQQDAEQKWPFGDHFLAQNPLSWEHRLLVLWSFPAFPLFLPFCGLVHSMWKFPGPGPESGHS